jgi:Domain of unknown function (DUF397)
MDVTSAAWRKSSYSGGNGGNCIEVALAWHKSSHSGGDGGGCIQVAPAENKIAVRDSKDPDGPRLQFSADDWRAFLALIKQ